MKDMDYPLLKVLVYHGGYTRELEVLRTCLEERARPFRYQLLPVATLKKLTANLEKGMRPDIILLALPDAYEDACRIIKRIAQIRKLHPDAVLITGTHNDDIRLVIRSIEEGADDYISKQVDLKRVPRDLFNIYQRSMERRRNALQNSGDQPKFVGRTVSRVDRSIPNIIRSAIGTIFVGGESGTGKEVIADLLATHLPENVPLVKVNCGAIAPSLMEAEFFGYTKGAFTGATTDKVGLFEQASGGWLFMDEVGNLTREAQAALLRVIENQEILRVGEATPRRISVRIISASNENLEQMVEEGRFRLDLWQRLSEKIIQLPPLRERREEIEDLGTFFCQTMRGGPYSITRPAMDILCGLSWREGNIRQLRNCLRAMTERAVNKTLTPAAIPGHIWERLSTRPAMGAEDPAPAGNRLVLSWQGKDLPDFESLSDQLPI